MTLPQPGTPQSAADRRLSLDRRASRGERRTGETPATPPPFERRSGGDRRAQLERRLSLQSAEDQIRSALKLLTTVADDRALGDQQRRSLEAAMLRLRFAIERILDD